MTGPTCQREAIALALGAVLSGGTWLGPEVPRSGRPAYNEAILTTYDEQWLQNIVPLRFTDSRLKFFPAQIA